MGHTRKEMIAYLAIGLSSVCMLAGCGGNTQEATASANKLLANGEACNPAWDSATVYREFAKVSYAGINYNGNFYSLGKRPDLYSSATTAAGQPWLIGYTCGGTATTTTTSATTTTTAITTTSTAANTTTTATTTTTTVGSASVTAAAGGGWKNNAIATQAGVFTVQFDASVTTSPTDAIVGLSNGAQMAFASFPVMVRFNTLGKIDARNGSAYAAANAIPFSANTLYHFRVVVDATNHTYSAYVKAPGGSEQAIGTNYAFRTEQATVSSINNWGAFVNAASGSETVSNFTIGSSSNLVHPGMLTSLSDLQAIKQHVANGDQPWANEMTKLKALVAKSTLHVPDNTKKIFCGGYNLDENGVKIVECDYAVENGIDAYSMALLGYLTGDKTYSDKAILFITTWADNWDPLESTCRHASLSIL